MIKEKGLVIITDADLMIESVIYNEYHIDFSFITKFNELFISADQSKAASFIEKVRQDEVALNWELNLTISHELVTLIFYGVQYNGKLLFAGSHNCTSLNSIFSDLMSLNNEQVNFIREISKNFSEKVKQLETESLETFDEMTRLNNELANLQRQLAKQNAELTQLNKLKNQFLGISAHDLRNPLGNILNFVEFIEEDIDRLSEEQTRFIDEIKMLSIFMLDMVNNLLDVSAIESGQVKLNLSQVNLVKVIENSIEINHLSAKKKKIVIHFNSETPVLMVTIDKMKIEQVLNNLISNALKFSNPGTNITLTLGDLGSSVKVEVKDEGLGIQTDELNLLFKAFQKTATHSTANEKSTGLGLFIIKKIIEAHNGQVAAESEYGKGSVFHFTLPKEIREIDEW
ncbi:MAG: HAMP domain-containing histidine kinase [Candidatus Marinimicrobia bacterium]|nr:HAMP domain-containing histidine kinase [Candidatus Neomarinimicrobiota bacterium]